MGIKYCESLGLATRLSLQARATILFIAHRNSPDRQSLTAFGVEFRHRPGSRLRTNRHQSTRTSSGDFDYLKKITRRSFGSFFHARGSIRRSFQYSILGNIIRRPIFHLLLDRVGRLRRFSLPRCGTINTDVLTHIVSPSAIRTNAFIQLNSLWY